MLVFSVSSSYLDRFFHKIVEDEENEDALAGHHEVVGGSHIADQLDSPEVPGGDGSTSGWEFNQEPEIRKYIIIYRNAWEVATEIVSLCPLTEHSGWSEV